MAGLGSGGMGFLVTVDEDIVFDIGVVMMMVEVEEEEDEVLLGRSLFALLVVELGSEIDVDREFAEFFFLLLLIFQRLSSYRVNVYG